MPTNPQNTIIQGLIKNDDNNNNKEKQTKKSDFPYKIVKVDSQINEQLLKDFTGECSGFVQVGPQKWFFRQSYEKEYANYYNFEVRPDDVWICTFPRSGTTWTQEMLWLLANNLDYKTASEISLVERFPFFEFNMFFHPIRKAEFLKENAHSKENQGIIEKASSPAWKTLSEQTTRRFIKTHLPFCLLPPNLLKSGCKVVYLARNPKDVAVSYYHLNRLFRTQGYINDFPTFWDYFERNLVEWSPYWSHIQQGWENRHSKNMLFMFYENINKDIQEAITKVANFLGKSLTNEELDKLEDHLKIENFRNNKSVNHDLIKQAGILIDDETFIRKGKTAGWGSYFTPELNQRADKWIKKHLKDTDLRFPL